MSFLICSGRGVRRRLRAPGSAAGAPAARRTCGAGGGARSPWCLGKLRLAKLGEAWVQVELEVSSLV